MSSIYEHTRHQIIEAGQNPEAIESIAKKLLLTKDLEVANDIYQEFELEANKLIWPQDHDFGALVLQTFSHDAVEQIEKFMLLKAIERARWCATCSTSGGEGLARTQHVRELEQLLSNK